MAGQAEVNLTEVCNRAPSLPARCRKRTAAKAPNPARSRLARTVAIMDGSLELKPFSRLRVGEVVAPDSEHSE